jgi:segregation and condensation protein B
LFVGNGDNRPLTSRRVASLMRGVPPDEIDDLVRELNSDYLREGRPYSIVSVGPGYRMQLRGEYAWMRDRYYGRVKEARLSQPAIDVLAIVAYRQPVSREDIDRIRSKPSGGMLAQLLRRGLLQLDRAGAAGGAFQYRTTDRFLQLFGLASLADLPQSQELPSDEGTF